MFNERTVFILGAGASWHYGYPTGEELVKRIIVMAKNAENFFRDCSQYGRHITHFVKAISESHQKFSYPTKAALEASRQCGALRERLEAVNPLVIDYFLGQNKDLQQIGKLMIAAVLKECEVGDHAFSHDGNPNRRVIMANSPNPMEQKAAIGLDCRKYKDDWVRFIVHKLTMRIKKSSELLKNQVNFVTFNYDVSLERRLFKSLSAIKLFEDKDIETFVKQRVFHVYGKLREDFASEHIPLKLASRSELRNNDSQYILKQEAFFNEAYDASLGIRTIGPDEKEKNKEILEQCEKRISDSHCLYILGYGFDEQNNTLLGLAKSFPHDAYKKVYFTNFCNSNKINKATSHLMLQKIFTSNYMREKHDTDGHINYFINNAIFNEKSDGIRKPHFEKSTGDVYTALESDFDI